MLLLFHIHQPPSRTRCDISSLSQHLVTKYCKTKNTHFVLWPLQVSHNALWCFPPPPSEWVFSGFEIDIHMPYEWLYSAALMWQTSYQIFNHIWESEWLLYLVMKYVFNALNTNTGYWNIFILSSYYGLFCSRKYAWYAIKLIFRIMMKHFYIRKFFK